MANLRANNLTGTGGRNAIDGSVFFSGADRLQSATSSDFAFGTGAYTLEFWVKSGRASGENGLFGSFTSSAYGIGIWHNGANLYFEERQDSYSGSNPRVTYSTFDWSNWNHLAMSRDSTSGTMRAFVNGVQVGTVTSNLRDITATSETTVGFNDAAANNAIAYISNLRLNNTQLYTAAFTPPTEKLTAVDGTVLLCCQDSNDPTQEATGKTITAYGNLQSGDDTNLVTNGGFTADISGWTNAQGTWAWNSGKAHMTGTSGNSLEQNVTTVVGKIYRLTATVDNTANVDYNVGIDIGGVLKYVKSSSIQSASRTFHADFTATATTTKIDLWGGTSVTGYWSDVTVKLIDPPKAPKVLPPVGVDEGVVFDGYTKMNSQGVMYFPTGTTEERGRSSRGVFGGGYKSPYATADNLNSLEYFNIQSTGNAVDFGDRTVVMSQGLATVASSTRGVMMGGRGYNYPASATNTSTDTIDYVTIATTANAIDFGNLVHGATYISAAGGNSTRGVLFRSSDADMEYITIATTGNSVDTGSDSTVGRNTFSGSASQTRAFWAGGANPSGGAAIATIDYLEIASLGVPQDFGDLTFTGHNQAASSNTRGIIFTGGFPSAASNTINYITIASTGNASDFGDLPANITSHSSGSGCSNSIRAVRCGGYLAPTSINRIDYVSIQSTGNAQDFGDLITIRHAASGFSDSHGGLS